MTIRLRTEWPRIPLRAYVILVAGLALAGCGGHHGSSSSNNTSLTATIQWPALSLSTRQASDLSGMSTSAVACIITTTSGNTSNGDPIDFTPILRDPTKVAAGTTIPAYTDSFVQVWNSNTVTQNPQQVLQGPTKVQVRFYAQLPSGTSSNVANNLIPSNYSQLPSVGDTSVIPITVAGATTDIGVLTVSPTIQSVQIASQTVTWGNTAPIPVTAYNSAGQPVAPSLQLGAATFSYIPSAVPIIGPNGTVTPNGLGSTTTAATVDGVQSNTVTIASNVGSTAGYNKLPNGVLYLDAAYSVIASGSTPAATGNSVAITYVGYFSNDPTNVNSISYTAFDTTYQTNPIAVTIGSDILVPGLDAGLVGMGIGDQRMIVVPPSLGYGAIAASVTTGTTAATVPGGSTLYYVVTRTN